MPRKPLVSRVSSAHGTGEPDLSLDAIACVEKKKYWDLVHQE